MLHSILQNSCNLYVEGDIKKITKHLGLMPNNNLGYSSVFVLNRKLGSRTEAVFSKKMKKASRELKLKLKLL